MPGAPPFDFGFHPHDTGIPRQAHATAFRRLLRLWEQCTHFSFILAVVDRADYRDALIAQLDARRPGIRIMIGTEDVAGDWLRYAQDACANGAQPLQVCLPLDIPRADVWWQKVNLLRERLADAVTLPLVVWLSNADVDRAAHHAPDLWNWREAVLELSIGLENPKAVEKADDLLIQRLVDSGDGFLSPARLRQIEAFLAHQTTVSEIDPILMATLRFEAAIGYLEQGPASRSFSEAAQAAKIFGDHGKMLSAARALEVMAQALSLQGDFAQAINVMIEQVLTEYERQLSIEPDRIDLQRSLSVAYHHTGDLYLALGQSNLARDAFLKALAIAERLVSNEPHRADFQRDLSVSFNKVGNLYLALGQGDLALDAFLKALTIAERLVSNEPDRADFQRDLSVSFNKVGDLYLALGQNDLARDAFLKSLAIREHLASNEPDRTDFQRDLSVSFERVGDLYLALGQVDLARDAFLKSLAIAERLASNEPDRADFQRDLSISFNKVGDFYLALGQGDLARDAFLKALAIVERLASNEPDRADFQRDLVISHVKMASISASAPEAGRWYAAAWQIVANLQSQGRWQPADDWMNAELAKRAAENGVTVG